MTFKLFLHGVPDTPEMWQPLIASLKLDTSQYHAPALPGFGSPLPAGFDCSADTYVDWFQDQIETAAERAGEPIDVIGHDWGAIIAMRASARIPQLVRSLAIAGAVPEPSYKWHRMARLWQTPLIGELVMWLTRPHQIRTMFQNSGLPVALAKAESDAFDDSMKASILKLYRSAKRLNQLANDPVTIHIKDLPAPGLIYWGSDDPYVAVSTAETYARRSGANLIIEPETGHWSIVQQADRLAAALNQYWSTTA